MADLYVAEEEQSRGLASRLIAEALVDERLREVGHLTLLASKPSIEAAASAMGFAKTSWQSAWMERLAR
ncbi:MAG: GNAT family N-acetyltransferase [Acidobacteriota bacterium]